MQARGGEEPQAGMSHCGPPQGPAGGNAVPDLDLMVLAPSSACWLEWLRVALALALRLCSGCWRWAPVEGVRPPHVWPGK